MYPMTPASVIAIDGPAASGKSTLAKALASRLGYLYFDTGVMYRAVTLAALRRQIDVSDEAAVGALAGQLAIDVRSKETANGVPYEVWMDGEIVTEWLRAPEIDRNVSRVSAYPQVRQAMTGLQRAIGHRGQVVMVGRDIGTVVLPDADLKLYVDASVQARADRRLAECLARGERTTYEAVLKQTMARDEYDSSRQVAPLKAAPDALRIDTTDLSIDEMVEVALRLVLSGRSPP
jgi:cytidylate kinase